jgi:hypothetical protein
LAYGANSFWDHDGLSHSKMFLLPASKH